MSLNDLNEDCLHQILSYFEYEPNKLREFATISRRFNELVQVYLVRHVSFRLDHPRTPSAERFELFLSAIQRRPELKRQIQTLELFWNVDNTILSARVNGLLSNLPGLSSLTLKQHAGTVPFELTFDLENAMPMLRHFCVVRGSVSTLCKALLHPQIQTIGANSLASLPERFLGRPTRTVYALLESLDLKECFFAPAIIQRLLQYRPNIRKLTFELASNTYVFSPKEITQALDAAKDTLEELVIRGHQQVFRDGVHDGSRMDLKEYGKLRVLDVPSSCVFRAKVRDRSRNFLHQHLPASLEYLRIYFTNDTGLFYLTEEDEESFWDDDDEVDEDWYKWLTEIVRYKLVSFPMLRTILIEELGSHHPVSWLNHSLARDAASAGVRLDVLLRRLRG
ncbi:hypothetical protein M501DRAFT_1013690 [Patellaria atrata CBS 101060]|uniref:F-box domain-containing protein n=1 Tax=Patellaria atrata CBS 101060 TaxID=1346257 RepID=A0A9P4SH03_9PEZI|nr:hypothetical protein M501DRAFT_1013690 [Patellaria atrata CBS 101060]